MVVTSSLVELGEERVAMAQTINPYVSGPSTRGEKGFFGRQDTLDWVTQRLRDPTVNSLVLFGQRGIGKTTLLLQLQHTLPDDVFLPVYFDLQDQATRPLGQVLADLADTVTEQVDIDPLDPEVFNDRGLFFNRTFLPQVYAALGKERRPVFLLDEFEVLDETTAAELPATAAVQSLIRLIRRVMNKDSRSVFVFTIGRRVNDLALDFTATFKASLVREVWVLNRQSAEAMVRQAEANNTLRFTDQAVARVLSLTNGHPYLTQLLCQQIWERAYAGNPTTLPRIDVPEVRAAVPKTLEMSDQAMTWLWNGLSLAEKIYAAGLAEAASEGETIADHRVMQLLTDHAARLRIREVELTASRDLVRRRVLDLTGEREHHFAVELFRRWVRQHKPLRDVKAELNQVDPLAENLFGIGQEFFRRNQWDVAARYLRDALMTNPHHFQAQLRLGETLLQLVRTNEAVAELERAYEQDQEEARSLLTQALVAQARRRVEAEDEDGALAACERALQVSPDDHAAQRIRGAILTRRLQAKARSYERAEQWTEAVGAYEQLVTQAFDEKSREMWEVALERCRKERLLTHLFSEGRGALEKKDWQRAQRSFAEVVHGRPDYGMNKQLAAQLLLQAVLRKPVRKYRRALIAALFTIVLVTLAGVLYLRLQLSKATQVLPPVSLPDNWQHVHTYRLDTNRDGSQEWVVLYRFDLPAESGQDSAPIAGVVYQLDGSDSSVLISHKLRPQGGEYLCECECTVAVEDVLSGLPGSELVVRDRCSDEVTRLTIFYWEPNERGYLSKGHFNGSRVEAALNNVTVDQRLPHRAQLALRQVYYPDDNKTYYGPFGQGILLMPEKYELAWYQPEPEDVTRSPYPEKVIFAFYNHYTDGKRVSEYFTERGWEQLEQCAPDRCGCASARSEITHVRVTYLRRAEDTHSDEDPNPDQATLNLNVICEHRNNAPESETAVRWYLVRQDGRWKLDSAEMIPAEEQERDEQ